MIAKIESISYLQNSLAYCERGGELIVNSKCIGDSNDIFEQMKAQNSMNDKCKKNTFHAKIRMAPEDKGKLTLQDWIDISKMYANKIGFEDNMYAVYLHEEATENEHIHIIASRITDNNKAVSNSFTRYKNLDFCREIEKKYELRKVKRKLEALKKKEEFTKNDKRTQKLEEKIKSAIKQSDTIDDFVFHLKNLGIKTKIGRGIGFIDEKGVYSKGSSINRNYSLKGIENLLSYKGQKIEMNKDIRKVTPKIRHKPNQKLRRR